MHKNLFLLRNNVLYKLRKPYIKSDAVKNTAKLYYRGKGRCKERCHEECKNLNMIATFVQCWLAFS